MVSPKTVYRTKLVSATVLAGASLGALLIRFSQPKEEPISRSEPIRPQPVAPADEDCQPTKNDLRCEVRKGEADPLSLTFDPDSCGFCGDGVRQVTGNAGTPPVLDLDSGITSQQVTERPSETPESCPVDFHCGNGRSDFRRTYGSWLEPREDAGANATFTLGTKTITESVRSCPIDVRGNDRDGDAGADVAEEVEQSPVRQASSAWNCPSFVAPSEQADMMDMHSNSVWSALSRIYGAINSNAAALRQVLGTDATSKVEVRLNIRVEPRGYMSLNSISASCDNQPCGDSQSIINATQLSLSGLVMGAPEMECFWTLNVRVPNV